MKNRKVKCVKCKIDDRRFIVGKTYEVDEDGHITGEGFKYMENEFNLTSHFLNDYYEFEIIDDLRDKIFQNHNEITIREGDTLIFVGGKLFSTITGEWISRAEYYNQSLKDDSRGMKKYDIMKVYNPITKEIIYDRDDVDWSEVKVDTPILVSDNNIDWTRGYFAKYENGEIYTFYNGTTSWSNTPNKLWSWRYAKLADK